MGLLFDKYIPQEGLNSIFSDMQNCEIEVRPSQEGYNAPYFYLKKRAGLVTKKGWKTGYKAREGELEKLGFNEMVKESASSYVPTGIMIKPLVNSIISKIKKNSSSNIQKVMIVNSEFETLAEKEFNGDEAIVEVNLEKDKEYFILGYAREYGKVLPTVQTGITYPVSKSKTFQVTAGIGVPDTKNLTTTLESGNTSTSNNLWGIVYKANANIIITKVKKFTGSGATQLKFSRYDKVTKQWSTPEVATYDGQYAVLSKGYILKKGDKFWVANTANGSNFTYVTLNDEYPTNQNNDLRAYGSVYNGAPYDMDGEDPNTYYKNRFEIASVEYYPAFEEVGDKAYNFTELAITERDETSVPENYWKTIGNIVESKIFDDKMWMYTDKGYLYNFDGEELNIVSAEKQNISYLVTGKTFDLWDGEPKHILRLGNTFSLTKTGVLTGVEVRMRIQGKLSPSTFIQCHIVSVSNPKTIISSSKNLVGYSELTKEFKNIEFNFAGVELEGQEKYMFYIEAYFTDKDGYIEVDGSSTNSYTGNYTRSYNSETEEWTTETGMIGFHINTTTPMYIDQENFDDCMLIVDYLGGGIYPSDLSEYTVSSYDAQTGVVTLTTSTLNDTFLGKYAYIKSASQAKYQWRVVSAIPAANKFEAGAGAGYSLEPISGDKIIFYNKMEQQLWIPQIRKGPGTDDVQYLLAYDKSGNTQWRFFPKKRNLVMWDNRVLQLTEDRQAMMASSNIDYEISILDGAVSFGNSRAINMAAYGGYLIVFFENKVGLVKKEIVNSETGEFCYNYQDLLDVGIYSRESFLIQGGNLYIFADDKRLYSVDLSTVSLGEIIGKLEDQGGTLINYFDKFDGGTIKMYYQSGTLYLVYRSPEGWSEVFKYYDTFKAWLQDKYEYSGNFMNFLYTLKQDKYIPCGNLIYKMGGLNDDGKEIEQHIKVYGPVEGMHDLFTLVMTKLRLGLAEDGIGGYVKGTVGGFRPYVKRRNLEDLDIIKEINTFVDRDGTMGSDKTGNVMFGGEGSLKLKELLEKFSEIIDVSFKVGKKGTYFTIELINTTNRQLKLGAIVPYYNTDNPLAHYNKGVMR